MALHEKTAAAYKVKEKIATKKWRRMETMCSIISSDYSDLAALKEFQEDVQQTCNDCLKTNSENDHFIEREFYVVRPTNYRALKE